MIWSRFPRRGLPEAPLPLEIKVINDEIDACSGDLIVAITQVITGNTILTENHLILLEIYLDSNPKTLEETGEKDGFSPLLVSGRVAGEEEEEGP